MTKKTQKSATPTAHAVRLIPYYQVVNAVANACIQAACKLPPDTRKALQKAMTEETKVLAKGFLAQLWENAAIAAKKMVPICQDTGFAVLFVEMGEDCRIEGGGLSDALQDGVEIGYRKGYLRKSIVSDPLFQRKNTTTNTPPVIHWELVKGDRLSITLAPKGGGSENMSAIRMLKPSDGRAGVVDFVVETVCKAGGNPCPPTVVGVGVGGTFEKAAYLAKKALLRPIGKAHRNPDYAALEQEILEKINASGIGSQGLGGDITSYAVHIEEFPCHCASLPVAVNLNCHASRHVKVVL